MTTTVPFQLNAVYTSKSARVSELVARKAYEVYSHLYGSSQSFERLHERGGFGVGELFAYLYAHPFPKTEWRERSDEAFLGYFKGER